jgi:hypothetical protein
LIIDESHHHQDVGKQQNTKHGQGKQGTRRHFYLGQPVSRPTAANTHGYVFEIAESPTSEKSLTATPLSNKNDPDSVNMDLQGFRTSSGADPVGLGCTHRSLGDRRIQAAADMAPHVAPTIEGFMATVPITRVGLPSAS